MANHAAVTIPLAKIQRIQIYINRPLQTIAEIKAATGADYNSCQLFHRIIPFNTNSRRICRKNIQNVLFVEISVENAAIRIEGDASHVPRVLDIGIFRGGFRKIFTEIFAY